MLSDHSTIDAIKRSRRRITILFSDIEESTRHWERRGDIDARMILDRHNSLLFPVIRKFRGRVIKTLGDAIMAAFDNADNALKAAIAMQQTLAQERARDQYFSLRTRIGIHTGTGLVEEDDIFGDVVNVAAKVQTEADANQILLTSSTAARLERNPCPLTEHSSLKPKGKRKPVNVLECTWQEQPSLITNIKPDALLPLMKRQRFELLTYLAVGLCALFFIYYRYLRYLLADSGVSVSLNLINNTLHLPSDTLLFLLSMALALVVFVGYLLRSNFISRALLRTLNGLFGFGLVLFSFHALHEYIHPGFNQSWYGSIYQSQQQYVEVLVDGAPLHATADSASRTIKRLSDGDFFIFQDAIEINKRIWNKITLADTDAWIPQRILPAFGIAEQQLTVTRPFRFYYYDLYALVLSALGFILGFINFKIRPN
jgi:class 3 adenylate cyclase